MKKILIALLIAVMVLSLVACNKTVEETNDSENGDVEVNEDSGNGDAVVPDENDGEKEEEEEYVPFDYTAADMSEYVTLGDYKGLTYTLVDTELTDEEFADIINSALESTPAVEHITDRPVEEGDTVVIDYTGALEGEKFDGGTATGVSIVAAEDTGYIPGFATALIGHSAGEEFSADITFPDPYPNNPDFSGKNVTFLFRVNYIAGEETVYTIDMLDDDFVYENFNFSSVEEFLEEERALYAKQKAYITKTDMYNEIWAKVLDNAEMIKYPEGEVEYYFKTYREMYEYYASAYGMDYDAFLAEQVGQTEADVLKDCQTMVKDQVVLNAVAKELDAVVTDEEVTTKIQEFGAMYGTTSDSIVSYFGESTMKSTAQFDKVMEIIIGFSTPVEESTSDSAE